MKTKSILKRQARVLETTIRIGKSGITEGVVKEIKKQLGRKKLIKIKCLKSFIAKKDKKAVAAELAEKTGSEIIHQVGFVIVLHKK